MDTGPFFSGTIITPADDSRSTSHTAKGLCVRLGERGEAAICYDTELLRTSAAWTGPFLNIDPARYGIISPPKIAGEVKFTTPSMPGWTLAGSFADTRPFKPYGPLPRHHGRYNGLFLNGNRVVLSWSIGGTEVQETPWFESVSGVPIFTRALEISPSDRELELLVCGDDGVGQLISTSDGVSLHRLSTGMTTVKVAAHKSTLQVSLAIAPNSDTVKRALAQLTSQIQTKNPRSLIIPGPARWTAEIATRGKIGQADPKAGPLAVDTLTLPFENPYRALLFVSGHDFVKPGVIALCTLHGDVWFVSGVDERLERLRWKRFATGLFQPLGLKIVNGTIHVVGRDQITRLHDRDGNGEADWYENFNNDGQVTTNGHEYVTCLETDSRGNFYFLKGDSGSRTQHDGCLLRVTPDGKELSVFATGFRNANGMAIGPRDEITVAPQEGEWTPASGIFEVAPGGFHGAMSVHHREQPPRQFVQPICWLSRRLDNSSGGQVWIPPNCWGPLGGQLLHLSYGQCSLMLALRETVDGHRQAAAVPLAAKFESGVMRGRFNSADGHLYVSGLHGWVSNAVADGCLQRVRYVTNSHPSPTKIASYANGMLITFSQPLNREIAEDPDNYQIEQWNYRWSAQYGSPELRPSRQNVEGRDRLLVESATLLDAGKSVFLEIQNVQPVSVMQVDCQLAAADGNPFRQQLSYTIHRVDQTVMPATTITGPRRPKYLTDEQRKALVPGIVFRFAQPDQGDSIQDISIRRMATIFVLPGSAPSSFTAPGPFRVVMEGFVEVTEPGKIRIRGDGSGSARVFLKGELVAAFGDAVPDAEKRRLERVEHKLRGLVPLRVEYSHLDSRTAAEFRLLWQREAGVEESISPSALFCLGDRGGDRADMQLAEQRRRMVDVLVQHRCAKCHRFDPREAISTLDAATQDGPALQSAGDRLNPQWIAEWLLAPTEMRSNAMMPALLGHPTSVESRQKAADLAVFVASLKTKAAAEISQQDSKPTATESETGKQLFEQLGCMGCHRLTPAKESDEFDRLSLQHVAVKFQPQALLQFLMRPHANYQVTRMPDFQLGHAEAAALSAYLLRLPNSSTLEPRRFPAGDKEAGRRLAESLRCHACHDFGPALPRNDMAKLRTQIARNAEMKNGCFASSSAQAGAAPRWNFATGTRTALKAFLSSTDVSSWQHCAAEDAQRQFASLRCNVCHSRDETPSSLPTILAEEGELGWLPDPLPDLTWSGDRLQQAWMERFLAGSSPERLRPHLKTRMPRFPEYGSVLARGFADQHGIGAESTAPTDHANSVADLALGYRLTLKDGGLDCRQCHAVGSQPAQGDDKTRLAPGIDFAVIPGRMRYDFYRRFVLDPPKYELNTRMPKFSADGRTTSVRQIHDGDARRQFDSIWRYLQTIHGAEP